VTRARCPSSSVITSRAMTSSALGVQKSIPPKGVALEPYASARRVYWVVDNESSHRGQRSVEPMSARGPTRRLVHLPVHASWLNQSCLLGHLAQGDHTRRLRRPPLGQGPLPGQLRLRRRTRGRRERPQALPAALRRIRLAGNAEDALDCACGLYLRRTVSLRGNASAPEHPT
jgi:hypothetical protein